MAKKQIVSYSYACDVCGDPIPDSAGDGATRKISWEGTDYVVDVCDKHGSELVELLRHLNVFATAGRRVGAQRGRRAAASAASTRAPRQAAATDGAKATAPKRGDLGAIRSWAQANGHKVGDRGRIPAALIQAYESANAGAGAAAGTSAPEAAKSQTPASGAVRSEATPAKRRPRKSAAATSSAPAKATPRKRTPRASDAATNGSAPQAATRKRAPRKAAAEASAG